MLHLPLVVGFHHAVQLFDRSRPGKYTSHGSNSAAGRIYVRSEFVDRPDDYTSRTKFLQDKMLTVPISWKSTANVKYTTPNLVDDLQEEEEEENKWNEELHADSSKWERLLDDPLHPWLHGEIIKYGEFAQATYDAFNNDPFPEWYGNCRYRRHRLFDELHLTKHGYQVTKYIYAMSHVGVLHFLERSQSPHTWSKDSNWIGFVAVSTDDESKRIGRRDIVMAWRGTVAVSEWISDLEAKLELIDDEDVMVEYGFHKIYTSKCESTRYNKLSASEQVMEEVKELEKKYREKGEKVSFTITGHSLGGALALLNAYEAAASLPDLPITVISFGAPQVGNIAFMEKINEMKVKTLRIVVKQDKVPTLPGEILLIKILQTLLSITGMKKWVYAHVGKEIALDITSSPHLKPKFSYKDCHNLEICLHLIGRLHCEDSGFWGGERDIALVNKNTGMLLEKIGIPENWYQVAHKGLIFNSIICRWIKPSRVNEQDED